MYTHTTVDGKVCLWQYHICLRCYREICLNLEQYVHVVIGGHSIFIHRNCPPLKEPINDSLRRLK